MRKIDETAQLRGTLPRQLGYVSGLQVRAEPYVGLHLGPISGPPNSSYQGPYPTRLPPCLLIRCLQEIYARRVGLTGRLPAELGLLRQLRVLSMGNNMVRPCLGPCRGPHLRLLSFIAQHE